jgi:hypothetical protein
MKSPTGAVRAPQVDGARDDRLARASHERRQPLRLRGHQEHRDRGFSCPFIARL